MIKIATRPGTNALRHSSACRRRSRRRKTEWKNDNRHHEHASSLESLICHAQSTDSPLTTVSRTSTSGERSRNVENDRSSDASRMLSTSSSSLSTSSQGQCLKGLNPDEYDPETLKIAFQGREWELFSRGVEIVFKFSGFLFNVLVVDPLTLSATTPGAVASSSNWTQNYANRQSTRAVEFRSILTSLGAAFVKIGQALSVRPDLMNKQYLDALEKLQDQIPSFDTDTAVRMASNNITLQSCE